MRVEEYLKQIGVRDLSRLTSAIDPGYSPFEVESHLDQSGHLLTTLKISMASWLLTDGTSIRRKTRSAKKNGVSTVAGGGPFEIAVAKGRLDGFLDLCAEMDIDRIEAGQGFTDMNLPPEQVIEAARERGLEVQFELGKKQGGFFTESTVKGLIDQGKRWLDAGAVQLIVEARESGRGVGLFDERGLLDSAKAQQFVDALGLEAIVFEAPTKSSQFAILNHFGPLVQLANVRLEEILRVEIYRRGLHSDAFHRANLRPPDADATGGP